MNKKIDAKEWAEDFKFFMGASEVAPPAHLRDEIFKTVHQDLNPSLWLVLSKLGGIHVVVGSLSLLICTQFGMGRGSMLIPALMDYGATVCMAFCGALFLGLTTFIAGFVLSQFELKKIRRTGYAPITLLGVISLTVFFCFGADMAFDFALAWFLGAVTTGILVTEVSLGIKRFVFRHA